MGFWIGSLGGSREAQGGQEPSLVLQSRSRSFLAAPTLLFDKLTKNVSDTVKYQSLNTFSTFFADHSKYCSLKQVRYED